MKSAEILAECHERQERALEVFRREVRDKLASIGLIADDSTILFSLNTVSRLVVTFTASALVAGDFGEPLGGPKV